ncbi:MAG: hypothetical protein PSN04_06915 [Methyloprofundus sp.]|nr:hypothetical protein [Methyloprofundus sp.]
MKLYLLLYLLSFFIGNYTQAVLAENADFSLSELSSTHYLNTKKIADTSLQSCQSDDYAYAPILPDNSFDDVKSKVSLIYLNESVKSKLNQMSSGVFQHVAMKVAGSLLSFNSNALSPENIASYITEATQAYLPIIYANGVAIAAVTSNGNTIIYKTEMPVTKNNIHAAELAAAGRESTVSAICDDLDQVNDLLKQKIVIQYNYYDSTGAFYSSFSLNGYTEEI